MNSDKAKERRDNLRKMKDKVSGSSSSKNAGISPGSAADAGEETEGAELLTFVKTLKQRADKRKQQLSIIKRLCEDPIRFGLEKEIIPSSSDAEEIAERKKELQYRVEILRAVLEAAEGELRLLSQTAQAEPAAEEDQT